MLKEEDKIFKNLYGFDDWSLSGAKKRDNNLCSDTYLQKLERLDDLICKDSTGKGGQTDAATSRYPMGCGT